MVDIATDHAVLAASLDHHAGTAKITDFATGDQDIGAATDFHAGAQPALQREPAERHMGNIVEPDKGFVHVGDQDGKLCFRSPGGQR